MTHGTWEPTPAARWEDAFLAGNGHHGALVYGDPADDRVIVTHHLLVRPVHAPGDTRPPRLADRLPALRDRLLAGEPDAGDTFTDGRPLLRPRPFHPAFQTRLTTPAGPARGPYRRAVDFATGVVTATHGPRRSDVFVSRADDVLVQRITVPGERTELRLDHRLPGAPADLTVAHDVHRTPYGALLTLRAGYGGHGAGSGYTGLTLALADRGTLTPGPTGVRCEGARELLLLTRVIPHDGRPGLDGAVAALAALPRGTPAATHARLLDRHLALHRTAYRRVTLDLDAPAEERALPGSELLRHPGSPALLERLFAAGRHHLLSSAGLLPPRLTGLWTGDWDTAWSGAFTHDANLGLQTASAVAADLPEATGALRDLILGQLDDWRDNAREVFGTRGVVAPAHTDGVSGHAYHFSREYPLHVWTAGADWLLKPLVDHAETHGVRDPEVTAVLAEVALFYEDFLVETGPGGRLAVVPSYSPENRPVGGGWAAVDATMDLTAARHALLTAADHHPGPRADRWRALAGRLPAYRINADGALAEWAAPGLGDRYDHRHLSHLYAVWPHDEINPYDTPALARAAHRALALRGAENSSAHGHLHQGLIAARLRDPERVGAALHRLLTGRYFHASLMSAHYPDLDVYNADAAHTLPALVVETLLQSSPGRLVLLPAPLAALPSGRLTGIRTRFGATVDLAWSPRGGTAVLRPDRTVRLGLRTPDGARPLDLRAGEDRVVKFGCPRPARVPSLPPWTADPP
ncbi:glycosyl hydrolase family 95 catalytic domain-containing protein [Streptomyces sp. NPDC126499]|uniref:glycosyl hydrolase family 95 catalytic domain-containing protein n=1 Tax=Streptomyces sp. NPDC126499 TaxID=3155314 RepID=UPI00331CDCC6